MDHQRCERRRNYRDEGGGGLQVIAKAPGTATITVKTEDGGKTASCTVTIKEKIIPVESITLDQSEKTLNIGETVTLKATVSPENATNKNISWSSDKTDVATVDENGNVSANSVGTATITAKAGERSATCTVTVSKIPVSSITINGAEPTLVEGDTLILTATITPSDASYKTVTWTSNNKSVATVDENGKVTAISVGTATIKATADGVIAERTITVVKKVIHVESITLTETKAEMLEGEYFWLHATVNPWNATYKTVTWTSDNSGVATVDENGKVSSIAEGTATITATADGKTATCTVKVIIPVESVTIVNAPLEMTEGDTITLEAEVLPENATNKTVTWFSRNPEFATIDEETGFLKALKPGTVDITVKAGNGKDETKRIYIKEAPVIAESITLDKNNAELNVNETLKLTATILPDGANKNVTWSTSDEGIAKVDSNGVVIGISAGEATITATAVGGKTASCKINVKYISLNGISLNKTEAFLKVNDTLPLTVTFDPDNASNKKVTWNSDKPEIATVDDKGNVKAVSHGTAIITATADGKTATCNISVVTETDGALTYKFSSYVKTAYVEKCDNSKIGSDGIVVIPDEYAGYKITEIGYKAFENCTNLKSVTIGQNVGTIKGNAFYGCTGLTSITIPGNVEIVYGNAFEGCSDLTSVTLEEGIGQINGYVFSDCTSLSEITIPETVTTIGSGAFSNCTSLSTVTIGSGVTSIDDNTFYKCPIINLDNKSSVTPKIAYTSDIYKKVGTPKILEIGSIYTSIESQAFMETSIEEITIPSKITSIGDYAFWKCKDLKKVTIREGIKSIGNSAFNSCSKLTEIVIPNSVTYFGADVFRYCSSLSNVTIGSGITSLYDYTFEDCPITSLTNYSSVTPKIEYIRAIYDKDENKESPTIGGIYTSIGEGAFMGTGVKTVVIPANITSIGYQAFDSCDGLTEITIPGTVKRIERGAFYNCTNLSTVRINSGVEYIEETAFLGCPITDLTNDSGLSLNVAYTSAMYKGEPNPVIEDFYTIIDNNAFQGREELQSITIPDNIKEIGGYAFEGCSNLSMVNFGPGSKLTSIGPNAFQNCTALTSITLPNSVTTIYAAAFSSSGLTSISIPDSVFQIDSQTFMGCTALSSVSIGTGVKTIGNYAFDGCTSLTSVEIPDNVTFIYDGGFDGCSGLTSVTIGEGITSIGQSAFRGCTSVTEYVFRGNTPPELRYEALSGLGEFDIFVPNEAVAAYEKAWPEYVGQIKTR